MPAAAAVQPGSPPGLTPAEGKLWCELVERRSGLFFPASQWHYLRRALWERMQVCGTASYSDYYRVVAQPGAPEWPSLLAGLLNSETAFFRHQPSFAALDRILRARAAGSPAVQLWSAGCSTGEEAYSLAMAAAAAVAPGNEWQALGTDLDAESLTRARAGVYQARQLAHVPAAFRARYLREAGRAGEWQVTNPIRDHTRFDGFHLLDPATFPRRAFHVIFCFNVLVYFRPDARQAAARAMIERLEPGGYLFLAPGESAGLAMPGVEPVRLEGTQAWRRPATGRTGEEEKTREWA
jgi:type IV pilus assembly protein PilK